MKTIRNRSRFASISAFALILTVAVCLVHGPEVRAWGLESVKGSGVVQSQPRTVGDFDAVVLTDSSNLDIRMGTPIAVTVEADDNVLELIKTSVISGALVVESKGSYSSAHPVKVHITMPSLRQLDIGGSGDARIDGLSGKSVTFSVKGSGDIVAKGISNLVKVNVEGSGDVDLHDLVVERAQVQVDGSGDVRVHATRSLDATINGSGDIRYGGAPPQLSSHVNGSGDISRE